MMTSVGTRKSEPKSMESDMWQTENMYMLVNGTANIYGVYRCRWTNTYEQYESILPGLSPKLSAPKVLF